MDLPVNERTRIMNRKLADIILDALEGYSYNEIHQAIMLCNLQGRMGAFIDSENLHLFRQYRNTVSCDPDYLIEQATHY